ncbi:S-layer homology domain-containing protein [Clostridia bacterium]|nr:S-layer homology domain-containing protein [Clostridia bacterium]
MKVQIKLIAITVLFSLLFSFASPSLAASIEAQRAGTILKDIGVIVGYTDGSLGIDHTITRAEMTVVLAKIGNMDKSATFLNDAATKFSDVKSNVWYTGYINLAVQQKWVVGYPDGTFRPNDEVSYSEAITMILNLLGYGKGTLPGVWPSNYLVQAAKLDITDDVVAFAPRAAAPRGDVFVIAEAACYSDYVIWNANSFSFVDDATKTKPINGLTSGITEEITITDGYMMVGSDLSDTKREVVADGRKYSVALGFDIYPYIGIPSTFYLNKSNEIFAIKDSVKVSTAKLLKFEGSTMYLDLNNNRSFDSGDKKYELSNDAICIINDELREVPTGKDTMVQYILENNKNVVYAKLVNYAEMNEGLVKSVRIGERDLTIKFFSTEDELVIDLKDDQFRYHGVASYYLDLNKYDILSWNEYDRTSKDDYAIYTNRNVVLGIADRFVNNNYIRIGDSKYYFDAVYQSKNNGQHFSEKNGDVAAFSNKEVTAYLNGDGNLFAISGDIESQNEGVALVVHSGKTAIEWGKNVYRIDLFTESGVHTTYYFAEAKGSFNPSDVYDAFDPGTLVSYGLDSSGKINSFMAYTEEFSIMPVYVDNTYTQNYNRIQNISGSKFYATADTVIMNADPNGDKDFKDAEIMTWEKVEAISENRNNEKVSAYAYSNSEQDLTYLVFEEPEMSLATDYAVFDASWKVGKNDYVAITSSTGFQELQHDGATPKYPKGTIVEVVGSGDVVKIQSVVVLKGVLGTSAYNATRNTVTVGGMVYDIGQEAFVVDARLTDPIRTTFDKLRKDDKIFVYSEEGEIKLVSIVTSF